GWGPAVDRLRLSFRGEGRRLPVAVFFVTAETADRAKVVPLLAELRRRGLRADMDYAGRSQKGQLGQASRLHAGWTVIVDGGHATVREPGRDDWTARLDQLAGKVLR